MNKRPGQRVTSNPDKDRYLLRSENNAADIETITETIDSLLNLQHLQSHWRNVKMEDDTHQPDETNSHLRVMKTYLKARYRLSDLLTAQRNERMTSNLKRWIENGTPDKGDLEEDSYRILKHYSMQKEGSL